MQRRQTRFTPVSSAIVLLLILGLLAACGAPAPPAAPSSTLAGSARQAPTTTEGDEEASGDILYLPPLEPASLDGAPLRVVATTGIIGDVVARVGGDAIELTTLMEPGQDPHSYEPGARQLSVIEDAHVVFINGWDLEEGLVDDLETIAGDLPLVPVSAGIQPLAFADQDGQPDDAHKGIDPHVWFNIANVERWVHNIVDVLSSLDPANAEMYGANGAGYLEELAALEQYAREQLATIPQGRRTLVTNHDAFGHFARAYDMAVLGTVIPGSSTLAEPSAIALANLIQGMEEEGVCTIFTETTVNDRLAQTVAAELDGCDDVRVLPLYTGALGPRGSDADSYLGMFRANVDAIVRGLR